VCSVPRLPVIKEGSKASFPKLGEVGAEMVVSSQIGLEIASDEGLKVEHLVAVLKPIAQPPLGELPGGPLGNS
jgi:hypothetical protein